VVDGKNQLRDQKLFIKVGEGLVTSLGDLSLDSFVVSDADGDGDDDTAVALFTDTGFEIEVIWKLIGGVIGSRTSTLEETITIRSVVEGSTSFSFFQESNFDLGSSPGDNSLGDIVQIFPPNVAFQEEPTASSGPVISETVVSPNPTHSIVNDTKTKSPTV